MARRTTGTARGRFSAVALALGLSIVITVALALDELMATRSR
jgi:hypothetical protein